MDILYKAKTVGTHAFENNCWLCYWHLVLSNTVYVQVRICLYSRQSCLLFLHHLSNLVCRD